MKFTTTIGKYILIPNSNALISLSVVMAILGAANANVLPEAVTAAATPQAVATPQAAAAQGGEKPAECNISCSIWYATCYYRPWAYKCDKRGKFVYRGWNPDCEEHCFCKCDSK
ncbi:hypothetical protein F53441_6354 [Fusarium austroafricanum]|uniref:Uncharacterized protein n=1 Tax=Fusarium austroafricanum TaxID=2364996 RepID=A0A8H4KJ04_9HYPO|nr:hypothetical protein F53441_6354 [Fusarium austroafricanum]